MTQNLEHRFLSHIDGEDRGDRNPYINFEKEDIIRDIGYEGLVPILDVILITLDRIEASSLEYSLIKNIKIIRDGGPLTNKIIGSVGFRGLSWSEEAKQSRSESAKEIFIKNKNLGKEHSIIIRELYKNNPDVIQQISSSVKSLWKNPEYRKKQSDSHKKAFEKNPSLRSKCSWNKKKWIVIDPNNKEIEVDNLVDFCKNNGIVYNTFIANQDSEKSCNGWKLRNVLKEF
jgi:hypothetical protein